MANLIQEVDNTSATTFVNTTSRYVDSSVVYYGEDGIMTFTTYKRKETPSSSDDRFFLINKGQEYRPDIVSSIAYGISDLWWKIMEANQMSDILDFKAGTTIRVPNNIGF